MITLGGLAVYLHADYIASLLPDHIKYGASPLSGFFLNHANVEGAYVYRDQIQSMFISIYIYMYMGILELLSCLC